MRPIQYAVPRTIADAVTMLQECGPRARVLAGGTDLIVQLNEYLCDADVVVDAKRIPELMELSFDPNRGLTIGAAVPCYRIYNEPEVRDYYPGLVDAVTIIGGTAIQGRASVGGNLCNSGPAADTIPALISHSAVAEIAGPDGRREVPVEEFCTAPGKNVLQPGEMLVAIHLPTLPPRFGASYLRFIPRNEMDIAVVGVGASLALDDDRSTITAARIALGAVAPTPLYVEQAGEALVGRQATEESFAVAALIAQTAARPIDDMRGTAVHRKHLAGVLTKRALNMAVDRAKTR